MSTLFTRHSCPSFARGEIIRPRIHFFTIFLKRSFLEWIEINFFPGEIEDRLKCCVSVSKQRVGMFMLLKVIMSRVNFKIGCWNVQLFKVINCFQC